MFKKDSRKLSVEVLEKCAPVIIVEKTALAKMKVYIDECENEIGWLGTAHKEDGFFHITDVMLFEQEVHATTTEITPEGLSDFGMKLLENENGMEIWNSIKVWGHSHVNMSIFPSAQDNSQMEVFSGNGHDFFIRIIANKKGEMNLDLYDYETGVIYKNIDWYPNETESERTIKEEIDKLEEAVEQLQAFLSDMDEKLITDVEEDIKAEMKIKVSKKGWGTVTTYKGTSTTYDDYISKKIDDSAKKKAEVRGTEDKTDTNIKYFPGLQYDDETGEYEYPSFETHDIDQLTLIEIALCTTEKEAQETLDLNGYFNWVEAIELTKLMNDLKNDKTYGFYGGAM